MTVHALHSLIDFLFSGKIRGGVPKALACLHIGTYSSSPSDGAASSISMGINLPLDGCSGIFFFFLLTLFRITLAKSLMSSFCVDCGDLNGNK